MKLLRASVLLISLGVSALSAAPGDLDPAFLAGIGAGLTPSSYPTFDTGTGATNAVALQPTGKIVAGGNISRFNHTGDLTALKRLNADGTLDATFNAPGGIAGAGLAASSGQPEVNALLVEPDGKIYVGGTFATYNGTARSSFLRLDADGALDSTFNFIAGMSGGNRYVQAIAKQGDKVLIGGGFILSGYVNLARLNANGSVDTTFVSAGFTTNGAVRDIAVDADGRIYVAGLTFNASLNRNDPVLRRYFADGTRDFSFNPVFGNDYGSIGAVLVLPDGRIVVGGSFALPGSPTIRNYACFTADGSLATDFQPDSGSNGDVMNLMLTTDGRIAASGIFTLIGGQTRASIAIFNLDGTIDANFAPQPYLERNNGYITHFYSLAQQTDGRILAGGWFNHVSSAAVDTYNLTRFEGDFGTGPGQLGFTGPGYFVIESGGTATISVARTGGLNGAVSVSFGTSPTSADAADFTATSGTLSWADGEGGVKTFTVAITNDTLAEPTEIAALLLTSPTGGATLSRQLSALFIRDDDSPPTILLHPLGGNVDQGDSHTLSVAFESAIAATIKWQFDSGSGFADIPFANGLTYTINSADIANHTGSYRAIVTNANGSATSNAAAIVIKIPAGALVTGFNPSTVLAQVIASDLDPAGNLVLAGYTSSVTGALVRMSAAGVIDPTFNPTFNNLLNDMVMLPDGSTLVAGAFTAANGTAQNYFAHIKVDGSLDMAANLNLTQAVNVISLGAGNTLYVGHSGSQGIKRFTLTGSTGTLDPTFVTTGLISGSNSSVQNIKERADGKVFVAYTSGTLGVAYSFRLLNSTGATDSSFTPVVTTGGPVADWDYLPDGRIVIVGNFGNVNGTAARGIAFIKPDGSLDTSYDFTTGFVYAPRGVRYLNGRLLVWGQFTTYKNTTINGIARINLDGSLDPTFKIGLGTNNLGGISTVTAMPDHRLFLGGGFNQFRGVSRNRVALIEPGPGVVGFDPATVTVNENAGSVTLTLKRFGVATGAASINYATVAGTATAGADFIAATGTVPWNAGDSANKTVTIAILQDTAIESAENFQVTLSNPVGEITVATSAAIALLDDDSFPAVTQHPTGASITEGQSFTLTGAATSPTAMQYQWYRNGQAIVSANAASYTVASAGSADVGTYFLRIYNVAGSIDTDSVTVGVALDPARNSSSFNFTTAITGNVRAIALLPEGGAYIGGEFSTVPGLAGGSYLMRVNENGALDTTFNPAPNGTVLAAVRQPDGKLLIGGNFNTVAGVSRGYLARLNADGTLDTAFSAALGVGPDFTVNAIALLPDGRIVIGGAFSAVSSASGTAYVALLKADGSRDTTFTSIANASLTAITVQPDGKILIAGTFTSYGTRLARIDATGARDTTFTATSVTTTSSSIQRILVLPDNRLAIVGTNLFGSADFEIVNANGTLAQSVNTTNSFNDVVLQDNGKLVAVGSFSISNGTRIARFSPSGSPAAYAQDTAFATGSGLNTTAYSMALAQNGNLWIGGGFTAYNGVTVNRLVKLNGEPVAVAITSQPADLTVNPAATLNFSVTAIGNAALTYQWRKDGVDLVNDARISGATSASLAITGAVEADEGNYTVVVTNATASRSATSRAAAVVVLGAPEILTPPTSAEFSASGTLTLSATVRGAAPLTYEWRRNGQLVANGGRVSGADTATLTIANSDVTDGGVFTLTVTNAVATASTQNFTVSVVLQPGLKVGTFAALSANSNVSQILPLADGGALVAGQFNTASDLAGADATSGGPYLARVKPNGEIDSTFALTLNGDVSRLAFAPDGGVIAIGYFTTVNSLAKNRILRLTPSLTLDTGWTGTVSLGGALRALAVDSTGRIYLGATYGGFSTTYLEIAERLLPNGTRDNAFSWGANHQIYHIDDIVIDAQDRALIAGNSMSSVGLARILPSGAVDSTFATGVINGNQSIFYTIALQSDGKILVGSTSAPGLRRLTADGATDSTFTNFNTGGVADFTVLYNDRILAVGGAVSTNGVNYIGRFDVNGAALNFNGPTSGFNVPPTTVAVAETGTLWIGGSFTSYNGQPVQRIIALNGDVPNLHISKHPVGAIIDPTASITLTARAVGTSEITYRWLKDGVEVSNGSGVSGATTNSLTFADANATHSGDYQLRISNSTGGTLTSSVATLIVRDAPEVTAPLQSLYRTSGQSATFTVGAVGVAPITYQWNKNGVAIAGAESANYTIPSVNRTDAGVYSVTITNSLGTTTSPGAALSVGTMPDYSPVKIATGYQFDEARLFAKLPDGRFYVAGGFSSVNGHATYGVARFLANGTVDTSFVSPFTGGTPSAMAAFPDGRVFVWGLVTNVSFTGHQLVNADGTSATFGSTALSNIVGTAQHALVGADGNLYVSYGYANSASNRPLLVKLSPTGEVLATFTGDGSAAIYDFAFLSGNRLAVVGSWTKSAVTRYADILDASFAPDPAFAAALSLNARVFDLAVLSDGDLLLGGQFTTVNGAARNSLARVNQDGTTDPAFLNGLAGPNGGIVNDLVPAGAGKILVLGSGTQFNGTVVNGFVRINEDGTLDSTYPLGTSPNIGITGSGYANAALVRNDGAIVVAGYNMPFKGVSVGAIGYLTAPEDGTLAIVAEPAAITQPAGSEVTLTVAARGFGPLTFQWFKDTVAIPGATATSYTLAQLAEDDEASYTVSVTSGATTQTSAAATVEIGTATPPADPFDTFLATANVPQNQRGPNDDPDGDGASNLLEYALALNPALADPSAMPSVTVVGSNLTYIYERARADVTYLVETSTDLVNWTATGVDQGTPDAEGITVASVPMSTSRFLRLKVTRP